MTETVPVAPRRLTAATLSGGAIISAVCFSVALLAGFAGADDARGDPTDVPELLAALVALRPWAWASLGILAVITTPAAGLLVTAAEYASVRDRRTVSLAVAVLGILAVSVVAALLT
jgi:uncharacterized membrane protein